MNQPWPLPEDTAVPIINFDLFNIEPVDGDLHAGWHQYHDGPDFFYTPLHGGYWVATRAEDIYDIYKDPDRFSNNGVSLFRESHGARFIPGEIDPPLHTAFRTVLNPETSPRRIKEFEEQARGLCCELLDQLSDQHQCEFHGAVAHKMPIFNFLTFMGLPLDDSKILLPHLDDISRSGDMAAFAKALSALHAYVDEKIEERRIKPMDDFIGRLIKAKIDGRDITKEEIRITVLNVTLGGLDTVTASMGFFMNFLAQNPSHVQQLVDDRTLIPMAVEELLRRHGVFNLGRLVKEDCEFKGIKLRKNDLILVPTSLHNLDERRFPDPLKVDFAREDKNHLTFGVGIHRCLGSNFARSQLIMLLEEWLKRIPKFSLAPGSKAQVKSGRANAVLSLELVW